MNNAASLWAAASAVIVFVMGTGHLLLTLFSDFFDTRDPGTARRMRDDSPRLTRRTTMWDAWIGFNASHSLGAVLLASFLWLAWRYWFRMPLAGLIAASVCYAAGLALG